MIQMNGGRMKVTDVLVNTFWKGEVQVQGVVEEENKRYNTKIYIKGSQMIDYSCSCAGGNSFQGMCDHGKALFETYSNREREEQKRYVSTSQAVRVMVREYTNREVARIMGEEETEKVKLVPRLLVNRRNVRLECLTGRSRLYQIKDLSAFVSAIENGTYAEYGKGLAFHHSIGAFDEESEPLLRLVMELTGSFREHYEQLKNSANVILPAFRSLGLNKAACDRFFSLVEGRELEVEDYRGQERRVNAVRKNPPLTIHVKNEGTEGIRVWIPEDFMTFAGERCLYVLEGDFVYQCDEEYTETLAIFLERMAQLPGTETALFVNKRDIPLFYGRVLKRMEGLGLLKADDTRLEQYQPEELKVQFQFDSAHPEEVSLTPVLSYGDFSFHPLDDEKLHNLICRDVPGEFRVSQLITRYFKYREDGTKNLIIRDNEEAIYRLLNEGIEQFRALGEVHFSESFRSLKIVKPPEISVGVSMNSGWLELTVDAEGLSRQDLSRILSEYTKKKKYYRLKNGEFLKLDDEGFLTISRLTDGLSIGKTDMQAESIRLENYRALYVDSIMKENRHIAYQRDSRFKQVVRGMKSIEDSNFEVPETLHGALREYQKNGFFWLKTLDEYGFGGILADDMGLGKTVQMITLLLDEKKGAAERQEKSLSLVICPASLVYNWCREFSVFAPTIKVLPVTGALSERKKSLEAAKEYDVIVTSYELLKRDLALYKEFSFRYEVLDEAQYIKNATTQTARAVKAVSARTRFALTGTPIENRLSELWSIFDFLMPGFLFSYRKFKTIFEVPVVKEENRAALDNLHRMIKPFVLRRLKKDVLKELPEKLEKIVYSAFEGKQKSLYAVNALRLKESIENGSADADGSGKIAILSELMRLRQICCDPSLCYGNYESGSAKLETCLELLSGAVAAGHKVLLFSQFASMLDIIENRILAEGMACHKLTGSTSKEERNRLVNSFHSDEVPIFLISLKAGGTGLNLTAADMVIHYDPWWNVAAQNQATDRAHRIGQRKQVTVYKLIMENTIEENILKLQESKKTLADQIVTEGMVSLSSIGREELLKILS